MTLVPRRRSFALCLLALLTANAWLVSPVRAGNAVSASFLQRQATRADPSEALYTESVVDMTVRVAGVDWRVDRLYADGWTVFPDWQPLDLEGDLSRYGDYTRKIYRGRFVYEIQTNPSPLVDGNPAVWIDRNDPGKRIEKTATGYRWRALSGDWIEYDAKGRARRIGNRYGHHLTLIYADDNPHWQRVEDTNSRTILTLTYHASGDIATVTDYSGRRVSYTWGLQHRLTQVVDVRGETWSYGYDGNLLHTKTDPLNRTTTIEYVEIPPGYMMTSSPVGGGGLSSGGGGGGGGSSGAVMPMPTPPQMRLASITDGDGRKTEYTFRYDPEDKTYWVGTVDPDGNFTETQYAAQNGTALQTLVNGEPGPQFLQSDSRDVQVDIEGRRTVYHKNGDGLVVRITYPDGASESREYHAVYDEITVERDARGTVYRTEWTPDGHLVRRVLAQGTAAEQVIEYTTNAYGQPLTVTYLGDANTAPATYTLTYDADGNLTSFTEPSTGDGIVRTTRWSDFDAAGYAHAMTDARGNVWQYEYDDAGNLTALTTPEGHVTAFAYNAVGDLIEAHLPSIDAPLNYQHDALGRITAITDPEGNTLTLGYNGQGQVESITDPAGHAHRFDYLGANRLTKLIDPANHVIGFSYRDVEDNPTSQPVNVTTPSFIEQREYDPRKRLTKSILVDPAGLIGNLETNYQYDANGNVIRITDPAGRITTFTYDVLDRLAQIRDAASGITRYQWDDRDNLVSVTDPNLSTTRYVYDAADRLIAEHRPEGQVWAYAYDANGNLKTLIRPDQSLVAYDYDKDNRLVSERRYGSVEQYQGDADGSQASEVVGYTWHPAGWLTGYQGPHSSATYVYDKSGRLVKETTDFGAFSKTQRYTWTADGLKATVTNPEGITYTYSWTALHQPLGVTVPGHGSITSLGYDWQVNSGWLYPGGSKLKQQHDAFLRLAQQRLVDPASTIRQGADYHYDQVSNITAITRYRRGTQTDGELAETPQTYAYDALDRLTAVTKSGTPTETYNYDAVGNRLTATGPGTASGAYSHDANHALTSRTTDEGAWSYRYDANGAMTEKTFTQTGAMEPAETWTYAYNLQNRLAEVEYNGIPVASYIYDPFGRRIRKVVHSAMTGGITGTTYFLYNGSGLVAEYDAAGTLKTEYHYVPGSFWSTNPLFARNGDTGQLHYAIPDHLATSTTLIKASGQIAWMADKTVFGRTAVTAENNKAGKPVTFNLRFPGQYEDQETGLHYNWKRYYDTGLGRYTNEDPIGLAGGLNPYRYAANNPLRFFDPTGELLGAAAALYGRCVLGCLGMAALGGALDAAMGCDPTFKPPLKACALDCLNPLNWIGGGKGPKLRFGPKPGPKKLTGSYTNTHASGKRYHGKGPPERMNKSARDKERKYNDPVVDQEWTPAANDREAFKDEARRIANDGGVDSPNNYNQVNSPGKKYLEQDGGP